MNSTDSAPATESAPIDYRFTLANERTYLAWIRTALALLAGSVALRTLVPPTRIAALLHLLALACVVLAAVLSVGAYLRWRSVEAAMERGGRLPRPRAVLLLAVGMASISVLVSVTVLLS